MPSGEVHRSFGDIKYRFIHYYYTHFLVQSITRNKNQNRAWEEISYSCGWQFSFPKWGIASYYLFLARAAVFWHHGLSNCLWQLFARTTLGFLNLPRLQIFWRFYLHLFCPFLSWLPEIPLNTRLKKKVTDSFYQCKADSSTYIFLFILVVVWISAIKSYCSLTPIID